MSLAFAPQGHKNAPDGVATVQKLLDENGRLIEAIKEYQTVGRADDAIKHQQLLHRNLVYLARLGDQSLLSQLTTDSDNRPNSTGNLHGSVPTPPPQPTPHPQLGLPSIHTPQGMSPQPKGQQQMLSPQGLSGPSNMTPQILPHSQSQVGPPPPSGFAPPPPPQHHGIAPGPPSQHPGMVGQMPPAHLQHSQQMGGMMGQNGPPQGMGQYPPGYEQQMIYQQQMMQQRQQQMQQANATQQQQQNFMR